MRTRKLGLSLDIPFSRKLPTPCMYMSREVSTANKPKGLFQRQVLSHHTSTDLKLPSAKLLGVQV